MPLQWLSAPITHLATLLANSATFRTFVGAADVATALNSIFDTETSQRPLLITTATVGGAGASDLRVAGNVSAIAKVGTTLKVTDSTANDGVYTVRAAATYAGGITTIPVEEAVPDATADGTLQLQWMPRALIGSSGGRRQQKQSISTWNTSGGGLWIMFEQETPAAYWDPDNGVDDPSAAAQAFRSTIETVLDEMQVLAGTNGYLAVKAWTEISPVMEATPDGNAGTPSWWCVIGVESGAGG